MKPYTYFYQYPIEPLIVLAIAFASPLTISSTFNPLFKVLFTFPSRYLFAIGLVCVFSFGWNLPPDLRSLPKEHDSSAQYNQLSLTHNGALTLHGSAFQRTSVSTPAFVKSHPTPHLSMIWFRARPCSFAITKGILVSFFSSA